MNRKYRGLASATDCRVLVIDGDAMKSRPLPLRKEVRLHSEEFAWAYQGSGPAQLALALLCDAVGERRAKPLYQEFKRQRIATLEEDQDWEMTQADIVAWVEQQERQP
jgi:hypothetical protein